ncbi:hypothetical protein [Serinibacter salmoneus]|uniref:Uncharacterized protein n=1 Tax=Serinibacter salmoneus TaxID=556530 RepID=A0A2A9CZT4_9MICO|nr:hypothetical protein [Serinibacter salmoneus]PFG19636.1 hypothetical protein ATL40_1204 [Serinibacter salmoneus]
MTDTPLLLGLVAAISLAISAAGGSVLVSALLRFADSREQRAATGAAARALRGGTTIGVLERIAVTGTILLGHPEGVAVVVAVKGLGRLPELAGKRADASGTGEAADLAAAISERFLIGTLASLLWATALGALGRWGLNLLGG